MKKLLCIVMFVVTGIRMNAEETEKKIKVEVHGYIGVNTFFDSRQNATSRNGNIYLYPLAPEFDNEGHDINKHSSFDIDAASSRFNLGVSGPEMFGAKTFGFIEGDFLGDKDKDGNDLYFRLRHAFVRFNWGKTNLLLGQTLHPLFLSENSPSTVTNSCGTPYHALNRQPMIRFGYRMNNKLELITFLMSQNDFSDKGMYKGVENSVRPELSLQLKYKNNGFFAAFTAGYKSLKPALIDDKNNLQTDELAQAAYVAGSVRKELQAVTVKAEAIYGGGMSNLVMLGGFAEKNNNSKQVEYTPLQILALWTDIQSNHKVIQPGLFIGYTQNMGASEAATSHPALTLGGNIGSMYTIAPRLRYYAMPKVWLGIEWMYTTAAYGSEYNDKAKPVNLKSVANHRITTSLRYTF